MVQREHIQIGIKNTALRLKSTLGYQTIVARCAGDSQLLNANAPADIISSAR